MRQSIALSLGGSVLIPSWYDERYIVRFSRFIKTLSHSYRIGIVCGGGEICRRAVRTARRIGVSHEDSLHWIGIRATQLNAEVMRSVLQVPTPVISSYRRLPSFRRIVVGAGERPGTSSDVRAVKLALLMRAKKVYNVTNVDGVYTADPRRFRSAKLIPVLDWTTYRRMFGKVFRPGSHYPFDPVASALAMRSGIEVVIVASDLANLKQAITGHRFHGTTIGT
jgi:uridylate kinase